MTNPNHIQIIAHKLPAQRVPSTPGSSKARVTLQVLPSIPQSISTAWQCSGVCALQCSLTISALWQSCRDPSWTELPRLQNPPGQIPKPKRKLWRSSYHHHLNYPVGFLTSCFMVTTPHPLRFATLHFIYLETNLTTNPSYLGVGTRISVAQP